MYENGEGVKQDFAKAAKYYQLAAKQENADTQYNLAYMFLNGTGVKQNKRIAKELFGKSCKNGNQEACEIYNQLK